MKENTLLVIAEKTALFLFWCLAFSLLFFVITVLFMQVLGCVFTLETGWEKEEMSLVWQNNPILNIFLNKMPASVTAQKSNKQGFSKCWKGKKLLKEMLSIHEVVQIS